MGSVDNSGAKAKAARLIDSVRTAVQSQLPQVGEVMMADVVARVPSKEEEYDILMRGEGNPEGVDLVPLSGDRSGDTDGRVRLQKEPGTWIADVVASPDNLQFDVGRLAVAIGNLAKHIAASTFSFKNIKYAWHKSQSYFEAFEFGSVAGPTADSAYNAIVEPRFPARKGGKYPLRPDEDPTKKLFRMYKPIRARAMYSATSLRRIARQKLVEILSQVGRGRSTL